MQHYSVYVTGNAAKKKKKRKENAGSYFKMSILF